MFSQTYYRRGDEIVLQLDVDPRTAAVNADFSAVDSQFRPAALRVEVTGRTERVIRYKLSQGNTRKAGTYRVAVHLEPAAGGATVTRKFPVEYLPGGPGELTAPTGSFVAGQLPRRERQREMSVVAALRQDGQAPVKNRIDPIKPVELSLVLSSPRRLSPNSLKLELAEARGDAFWRVPIRLTAERCTPVGCQYQALTSLDLGPAGGGGGNRTPALAGQLVTSGGAAVPFDLPGLGKTSRPSSPTHRISGTLRFQYQDRQPAPSPEYTLHPWRAPVQETTLQRPIRYASVRLEDECGHDITSTTTATGAFQFQWTPVNCGIGTVTVSAFSASQKAAVAYWLNEPIDSPGDLTGDSNDYRAYTWSFTFDTATAAIAAGGRDVGAQVVSKNATAARAFYILDNVMIARAYYDSLPGISMYFEAPTIGVVYSPGLKPDDQNCNEEWDPSGYLITAFYSPGKHEGFIYIPAEDGCDLGWDAHAIIHETSHLFQRHFLRGGEDIDYGRFGEGLANVQAAVIRGTKWIDRRRLRPARGPRRELPHGLLEERRARRGQDRWAQQPPRLPGRGRHGGLPAARPVGRLHGQRRLVPAGGLGPGGRVRRPGQRAARDPGTRGFCRPRTAGAARAPPDRSTSSTAAEATVRCCPPPRP